MFIEILYPILCEIGIFIFDQFGFWIVFSGASDPECSVKKGNLAIKI